MLVFSNDIFHDPLKIQISKTHLFPSNVSICQRNKHLSHLQRRLRLTDLIPVLTLLLTNSVTLNEFLNLSSLFSYQ